MRKHCRTPTKHRSVPNFRTRGMAANPALQIAADGKLMPIPYAGEVVALRRDAIDITLDSVRTATGKYALLDRLSASCTLAGSRMQLQCSNCSPNCCWSRWSVRGYLYLTSLRLVFVTGKEDASGRLSRLTSDCHLEVLLAAAVMSFLQVSPCAGLLQASRRSNFPCHTCEK